MVGRPTPQLTGDIPVNAQNDNATPPRTGMRRWIVPWEYRHLRGFGVTRIAGGTVAAAAGVVCLSYGVYDWAAFFLAIGALNIAGGYWYTTIARSAPSQA
jgi:hypothetical protein